jgi:hypothetical protein
LHMATPEPGLSEAPSVVKRITRPIEPTAFSRVGAVEARRARQGNRFDVAGGGVLYAATDASTCFHEVCSRFRPSPFYKNLDTSLDAAAGFQIGIPGDWRFNRRVYDLRVETELPFVDISDYRTWKWLEGRLRGLLYERGLEHIDAKDVYSDDRTLTRAFAGEIYTATCDDARPMFAGIRYESRLNNGECWAIFEDSAVEVTVLEERVISIDDPDLDAWARQWDVPLL